MRTARRLPQENKRTSRGHDCREGGGNDAVLRLGLEKEEGALMQASCSTLGLRALTPPQPHTPDL